MSEEIQNKDKQETFGYSDTIQAKILAMLMFDETKLIEAIDFVKPEFFDNPVHQEFARIIFAHYRKYRRRIGTDEFLEELDGLFSRTPSLPVDEYAEMKKAILESVEIVRKGKDYGEIVTKVQAAAAIGEPADGLGLVTLSEVEEKPVEWFWKDRIPKGEISLIVGNPGVGKSYLCTWIIAHVTTGRPWPTDPSCKVEEGHVILLTAEDSIAKIVKPRVRINEGDQEKVHVTKGTMERGGNYRMFSLLNDLPLLEKDIKKIGSVKLVIVDPVTSYLDVGKGRAIDPNKGEQVSSLLTPIERLCEKYGVTFIIIMHLNKSEDLGAIYRIAGSMRWTGAARAAWLVAEDKEDDQLKYFSAIKNNYSPMSKRLLKFAFRIKEGTIEIQEGEDIPDVEEILAPQTPEERKPKQRAKKFLRELFKDRKEIEAAEGLEMAKREGIKDATLTRAKEEMGIASFKQGDIWVWRPIRGTH